MGTRFSDLLHGELADTVARRDALIVHHDTLSAALRSVDREIGRLDDEIRRLSQELAYTA